MEVVCGNLVYAAFTP
ncbi:hypothetical protein OC512_21305 [Vibrio vulnificus]|nr:hypothetical protein [Vibrio vulnificus]MCU8404429.1 hypothetical protein [Vibrio vulnificus]MDS1805680.1 hypothetical protein [Vibrio vulnificus]